VLGTIEDDSGRQLVLADIPGLIEGASAGAGLGHEFLAHVERTRLLLHLVDVAPVDEASPGSTFEAVRAELRRYGAGLERKPFLLVLSKIDLVPNEAVEELTVRWRALLADDPNVARSDAEPQVLAVSSATGRGLELLGSAIFSARGVDPEAARLAAVPAGAGKTAHEQPAEHAVFHPAGRRGYRVTRRGTGSFEISGRPVERLIARHDLDNPESLSYIEERLRTMGVIKELEAQGFEPGQEITIGGVAFDLYPGVPHPD
jgi:GTP-binding protein